MAPTGNDFDVLIIGAGISGINAAYRVQTSTKRSYAILEAREALGGTWDLFKYPGIRSDSDLHTFGFPFQPWEGQEAIVAGSKILKYVNETASSHGIDKNILYKHTVKHFSWHSDSQKWSVDVVTGSNEKKRFWGNFVVLSTGYYDYNTPLQTKIPDLQNFGGQVIHPQFWPTDLDYTGKKMVIIGSGATAVTLLPSLAGKASKVTMLQRSPGYLINLPEIDPLGKFLSWILPGSAARALTRWKFLWLHWFFFLFCRRWPAIAKSALRLRTKGELPARIPHDPHFEPNYNPWEQRMCVVPDGDFYKCLRDGTGDIATGHIKTVTKDSIILESGQKIEADIIITATGLKLQVAGGAGIDVDGKKIHLPDKYLWNGMMLQDVPNISFVLGYTNASWTLGSDATSQSLVRLMNYMDENKITSSIPRVADSLQDMETRSVFNLNSTYVKAGETVLPKTGDKFPWLARSNYFTDIWRAKFGDLTTGLQYVKVSS